MAKKKNFKYMILPLLLSVTLFSGCGITDLLIFGAKEAVRNEAEQILTETTEKVKENGMDILKDTVIDVSTEAGNYLDGVSQELLQQIENIINSNGNANENLVDYSPYIIQNNNIPTFTADEITTEAYEYYSPHDLLGRCGPAEACIGLELMPAEERGSIGMVKPSGWHTVKYDCVDGKYLYNRCHLIGYQLTGENANEKNLITGTRYLNVEGMLPFENAVADYIEQTGNHVMYRVTPVFDGINMLASGVIMEAYSVEDGGKGMSFNVFCPNIQPEINIDYLTGNSREE